MLWLAHEKFDERDRKQARYTFAIAGKIYLLNASFNNEGFLMSELSPRNYELKRIAVELHNFVAPHSIYGGSLVVHNDKAYLWHARGQKLYAGWIDEEDKFHWEIVQTRGQIPSGRYGNAHCKHANSLIIFGGYIEEADMQSQATLQLDLDTMIWTERMTTIEEEDRFRLSSPSWEACGVLGGSKMHLLGTLGTEHLVLDLATNRWTKLNAGGSDELPEIFNAFFTSSDLYIFGFRRGVLGSFLYRYDAAANEWLTIRASGFDSDQLSPKYLNTTVLGTRIFFIEGLVGLENAGTSCASMSVLELEPNLFDHAVSVLLKSEHGREEIRKFLPSYMSSQLVHDEIEINNDPVEERDPAMSLMAALRQQLRRRVDP